MISSVLALLLLTSFFFGFACSCFFLLYSAISLSAWRFSFGSQELSLVGYPFHLTRKCILHPQPLGCTSRIFSTSNSCSLSIRSGGGWVKFGPCSSISLYGVIKFTWNTLCIFQCRGISSRSMASDNCSRTLNGPYRFGL